MATPRICVLRAPGTNCDVETAHAFELAGGAAERLHLFRLLEDPARLSDFQILCIPGGFSYGDDIGAGVVFGTQLKFHLGDAVRGFLQSDKLVLGICNGFQTLLKAGILPDGGEAFPPAPADAAPATLTWNVNGKYTALWVTLDVRSQQNVFLRGLERFELPIAHAEGRLVVRDESIVDQWRQRGQLALAYAPPDGQPALADKPLCYPLNPNGSFADVAGLGDPTGRILGLMPHPERYLFATQHPQWTRRRLEGDGTGLTIFRNAVDYYS
jgi:phosphoribosylformylglycinamidine synthase subunit PurQ / glutaminase